MAELTRAEVGTMLDALLTLPEYPLSEQGAMALLHSAQEYGIPLSEVATRKLAVMINLPIPEGHEFTIVPYMGGYRTTITRPGVKIAPEE